MTTLLVSVQNEQEAITALHAGAGIIDIKDPTQGGLAAANPDVWRQVTAAVKRRAPVSATLGNPPQQITEIIDKARLAVAAGIDIVKIGVATDDKEHIEDIARQVKHIPAHTVLVYLVDIISCPYIPTATDHIAAVMLDTRHKCSEGLSCHIKTQQIRSFIQQAHSDNMQAGLAGKLNQHDIPQLLPLQPDIIGVRSAITEGARDSAVSAARIQQLTPMFSSSNPVAWYNHDINVLPEKSDAMA